MTKITDATRREDYTAAAAQTVFPYSFELLAAADMSVYVDGVLQTYITDYTLSNVGVEGGGNVTFVTAMSGGEVVLLNGDKPIEKQSEFATGAATLLAAELNTQFSALTMMLQQLERDISRCVRADLASVAPSMQLPSKSDRAGKYLYFSDPAGAVEAATLATIGVTLSQSVIGAYLNPDTAGEVSASATISRPDIAAWSGFRYGLSESNSEAVNTGNLQDLINSAAQDHNKTAILPAGIFDISEFPELEYDVSSNPDFPSNVNDQARLRVIGQGNQDYQNFLNAHHVGTVLRKTTAGDLLAVGDAALSDRRHLELKNLSLFLDDSDGAGRVLFADNIHGFLNLDQVSMYSTASGHVCELRDCFLARTSNLQIIGSADSGQIGLYVYNSDAASGGNLFTGPTHVRNTDIGVRVGHETLASAATMHTPTLIGIHARDVNSGFEVLGGARQVTLLGCSVENAVNQSWRVARGAQSTLIQNCRNTGGVGYNTVADIVLGESASTAADNAHYGTRIRGHQWNDVRTIGVLREVSTNDGDVEVSGVMTGGDAAAIGVSITDEIQRGFRTRITFNGTFATEHAFPNRIIFDDPVLEKPADIGALTDSSGGTPADELVAISGSGDDVDLNNNFASIAADVNAIRTILRNKGDMQ